MRRRVFFLLLTAALGLAGSAGAEWTYQRVEVVYDAWASLEDHPHSKTLAMIVADWHSVNTGICIGYQNSLYETPSRGRVKALIEVTRFSGEGAPPQSEVLQLKGRVQRNRMSECVFLSATLRPGDLITAHVRFKNFPQLRWRELFEWDWINVSLSLNFFYY